MDDLQGGKGILSAQAIQCLREQDLELTRAGIPANPGGLIRLGGLSSRFLELLGDYHLQTPVLSPGHEVG